VAQRPVVLAEAAIDLRCDVSVDAHAVLALALRCVHGHSSLSRFKYLETHITADERSVRATWPDPPAPLVFWL
jgi:hypothetical protein